MKFSTLTIALLTICLLAQSAAADDLIGKEDFDGGALNLGTTTNVHNFPGMGGDFNSVFGVVTVGTMPSAVADDSVGNVSGMGPFANDALGICSQNGSRFFAMDDMDGTPLPGHTFAIWPFDISSAAFGLTAIQIDLAAMSNFETTSNDGFVIEAQIDGGGFQEIFRAAPDSAATKTYRPMDGGVAYGYDDPLALFIDGSSTSVGFLDKADPTTGNFDTYTSTLLAGQTGSMLEIRVSWTGPAEAFEPMGIDNICVRGLITLPVTCPDGFTVTIGSVNSGGFADLCDSDDSYLILDPQFTVSRYQLNVEIEATSPTETPSSLEFKLESRVQNFVGTVDQRMELLNFNTGTYELLDNQVVTSTDTVYTVTPGGTLSRFVEPGTRNMRARIRYQNSLPFWVTRTASLYLPYRIRLDQSVWTVN